MVSLVVSVVVSRKVVVFLTISVFWPGHCIQKKPGEPLPGGGWPAEYTDMPGSGYGVGWWGTG